MQRILRLLAPLALLLAALALVACGGGDSADTGGEAVGSDESAQKILEQTFATGDKKVEKGRVDAKIKIDFSGVEVNSGGVTSLDGPVDVELSGPFQSRGKGKVPMFDMDLAFSGQGQDIKGSATSTGEKGFLGFNGQDYAVDDATWDQFSKGYTDAQKQGQSAVDFESLGLKPATWFNEPKNEGDSKVGDTDTVKITASSLNLDNIARDLNTFATKAPQLGLSGTTDQLTDAEIQQLKDAVKGGTVEVETGKDDSILRRMKFTLNVDQNGQKADIDVDLSLTELGEDQEIKAPSDTKPLTELLGQFGGLGGLGALGTGGGTGSTPPASTATPSGAAQQAAEEYSKCIQEAGSDTAKLQECSALLTP